MNLITRDTDYAIRALCFMAQRPEQTVSVTDLCSQFEIPRQFLRRILQTLARHRILHSFRGRGGGFRLRRRPGNILLTDIIVIFQGEIDFTRCIFRGNVCPYTGACPLRKAIKRIERDSVRQLRATTISGLVAKAGPPVNAEET